jgi:hypothetical protein
MKFFEAFTIKHGKVVCIVVSFIILGFLDTLVADEEVRESIPSVLGGGDVANKRLVLLGEILFTRSVIQYHPVIKLINHVFANDV